MVNNFPPLSLFSIEETWFSLEKLKWLMNHPHPQRRTSLIDETKSDPPPQGPSNIIKVTTKGGKAIVVKREGDAQVQYEHELEKPDLREFKLRPIEKFEEASQ